MGCCAVRQSPEGENINIIAGFGEKQTLNDSINLTCNGEKQTVSTEFAKGFFKVKGGNPTNTGKFPNYCPNNLTEVAKHSPEIKNENIYHYQKEYQEKINKEEEQKEGFSFVRGSIDNSSMNLIKYPRMEIVLVNSKLNNANTDKIIITPNSINGVIKKMGEKFSFGRNAGNTGPSSLLGSLTTFAGKTNDYNFIDESVGPKQFEIGYSKEKEKFYIVDNKRGTGLFVKIKQKIMVTHDMIVSFCASHMILQVEPEIYHPENKIIKIRFLQGPHQNQEKVFNSKDKKIIRIGRSKQAEVVYKDDSVSRIQCTIVFENGEWNLYDGYLDNGSKGSTNGLWLLASSKLEMTDEMILKTGNTTMLIKLIESEDDINIDNIEN